MSGVTLSIGAGLERFRAACVSSIARTFADHIALYACAVVFGAITIGITIAYRLSLPLQASVTFLEIVPEFLLLAVALGAAVRLVTIMRSGARPLPDLMRWLSQQFLAGERPGNMFHTLVALTPLMISFAALKSEIPQIHAFSWDRTFMHWDMALFGMAPWRILQPVLGYPVITAALNGIYDGWFVAMFGCLFWQAFSARSTILRTQFLLAFAFAWFIGGNLLAVAFSSAGPCFYGHFFSPDPYAAQMEYLRHTAATWPVWSVRIQDLLWQSYATGSGAVSGISAMPSMHVMIAVLMALLGWRINRWAGAAFTLFACLIVIGSVHLGWHYAVDSIGAILLTLAFWYGAGAIARATAPRATG